MTDRRIYYQDGYRFQLRSDYTHQLPADLVSLIEKPIQTQFIDVTIDGLMTQKSGYSWDGASGPTRQTKTFARGSLVHDGGYQLIREGALPMSARPLLDAELKRICIEDGMNPFRAWYVMLAVSKLGTKAAIQNKNIMVAP